MSTGVKNLLLALAVVLIFTFPLVLMPDGTFQGTDNAAGELVQTLAPDYHPWFTGFWAPKSSSVESLLFSLQAAVGSGIICYYLGYRRGQKKERTVDDDSY